MKPKIKIAFASGTDDLNRRLIQRMREIFPELPLHVVSDFPPDDSDLTWIPYRLSRGFLENWRRIRAAVGSSEVRLAGVMLVPNVPFRRMRLIALLLAPAGFIAFNENLNDFMLRPRCLPAIARHWAWRARNLVRWGVRSARTADWAAVFWWTAARAAALFRIQGRYVPGGPVAHTGPTGISVVIPSRNGRALLEAQLPGIARELAPFESEIIVVDNGSDDRSADWLAIEWPGVIVETSAAPLSFAAAVNRGIARARFSRVCLLNNDMLLEPGFFAALARPFEHIPGLFCASAQIRFPEGVRREETGKTVFAQSHPEDFPVRCDEPLPGEDQTWVLYGSGGCSLYDAGMLRALGGVDEAYAPAYVEDLDLGYRAWRMGWPTVYVAGAVVEHRHRATTSRYYKDDELETILELNYLKFLARSVAHPKLFRTLWKAAVDRLRIRARGSHPARQALRAAAATALREPVLRLASQPEPESAILALADGSVAVFPGRTPTGKRRVLIASPYVPFPLSHGGAVRIFNLMRRAAADFDLVLVAFTEHAAPPPPEVIDLCVETVLVRRAGTHSLPFRGRPDAVEEFSSPAFAAAVRQTVRKWQPAIAQLEFTQMAQYAADCAPARTILVEHDITYDLYQQLVTEHGGNPGEAFELQQQLALWRRFERDAWRRVDAVVTMSGKDRRSVEGARAFTLPNGVDLERFRPAASTPEPRRLLFIGSFAHLPNLLALEFFLREVWPHLESASLHVIAGSRPEYFMDRYRDRVRLELRRPGIELEAFVADVRPAYERASVVIAPLVASAGTNIKILEAMAMGKAVVSTPAGVNGLDLAPGEDFVLAAGGKEMAEAIRNLLADPAARTRLESAARRRVELEFGWDAIGRRQALLYDQLARL